MARQLSGFIEGEIEGICFYKSEDLYWARRKSSLNGKRFWKDKSFEGSRKSCQRFREGNIVASRLYRMIESEKRVYQLFCFLKGRAILLLKSGMKINEVEEDMVEYLVEFEFLPGAQKKSYNKKVNTVLHSDGMGFRAKDLRPVATHDRAVFKLFELIMIAQ